MPRSKGGVKRTLPPKENMENAVREALRGTLSIRAAAEKYEVSKSAVARRVAANKNTPADDYNYVTNYDIHKIFTAEEELKLYEYIIQAGHMKYDLTKKETRQLAFKYAKALNKTIPQSWNADEAAGEYWLRLFQARHPQLTLRKPEATSMARAMGFNREAVETFFNNYSDILGRYDFSASQIWNTDETGLSTVQAPPKVLAEKGSKQVGQITSAERGSNVTMIAAISASGNSVPPLFVFPRKYFKERTIKGAPPGSIGKTSDSGWSNEDIFLCFLEHFIMHTKPSLDRPLILIMDNHQSHISIPVINKAKTAGVILLTIPPHTSHKIQPLDKTVYGPFKTFYYRAMADWLNNPCNKGQPVTIYEVAELN